MAKTITDYLRLFQSLLPRGYAWTRDEGSRLTEFLRGLAGEFVRIEERSDILLQEKEIRRSSELLIDHETDLGLPDECSEFSINIQQRRAYAYTKLIAAGRQDKQYFIDLAELLGFVITITEFDPDTFKWQINCNFQNDWIFFRSGSSRSGERLVYVPGVDLLICVLNKYKPAHTFFEIIGIGAAFDASFSSAFLSFSSDTQDYLEGGYDRSFDISFDFRRGGNFYFDSFGNGFDKPI